MQPFLALMIVAAVLASAGCVREQPHPPAKERADAKRLIPEGPPLAERDLSGKARARPRATMGALEAESGSAPPSKPKKRPPREAER